MFSNTFGTGDGGGEQVNVGPPVPMYRLGIYGLCRWVEEGGDQLLEVSIPGSGHQGHLHTWESCQDPGSVLWVEFHSPSPGRGASLDKASASTLSLPGIMWGKMDSDFLLQRDRMSCTSLVADRVLEEP